MVQTSRVLQQAGLLSDIVVPAIVTRPGKGYVVNSDIVGPAGDINKAIDGNGGCCAGEVVACGTVVPDEVRLT